MKRILCLLLLLTACQPAASDQSRRLIEWGWDTPSLQDVGASLAAAQNLPFDGLVLDVATPLDERGLSWTLFSQTPADTTVLAGLAEKYAHLAWGRLTDNFLRFTVHPANSDWFDDWGTILENARQWALLARRLGLVGIVLDVEQYGNAHLFDVSQRPSDYSAAEYARQAVTRGQELMRALESGFPGLTILFTYALTVDPVAIPADWLEPRYQLLAPFVEGMLSAASDKAMLIDGYESSYIYRDESRFRQAREQMLAVAPLYGVRIEQPLRVAFGLWIDPVCGLGGLPLDGCGFSPTEFKNAVDYAIRYSDRYVWIYSQNINWYTGSGIPENWREMMLTFRQGD